MNTFRRDDGTQPGPGEQIRPKGACENQNLDNVRGGVDPSAGQSPEVPRDNRKAGADAKSYDPVDTASKGLINEDRVGRGVSRGLSGWR